MKIINTVATYIFPLTIISLLWGCSGNNSNWDSFDNIPSLFYNSDWLVYVWTNNGSDTLFKNHKKSSDPYSHIYIPSNDINRESFNTIIYTHSGKHWAEWNGKTTQKYDTLTFERVSNNIPYFNASSWGIQYLLKGVEFIKEWNGLTLLDVSWSGVLIRTAKGVEYEGELFTWAENAWFYKTWILTLTVSNNQNYSLGYNHVTIFSWVVEGKTNSISLKWNGANVLEILHLDDGEDDDTKGYIQYIVNWISHEKHQMLNEMHVPFFSSKNTIYAYLNDWKYHVYMNGRSFGPYINYPRIFIYNWDNKVLIIGDTGDKNEVLDGDKKVGSYDFISDIVYSSNKQHIAFMADAEIFLDTISTWDKTKSIPLIVSNTGEIIWYRKIDSPENIYYFNDKQYTFSQPLSPLSFDGLMNNSDTIYFSILDDKHFISIKEWKLYIDSTELQGFHSLNPHGGITCGNNVFLLENIEPNPIDSELLIWKNSQFTVIKNYGWDVAISPNCLNIAYSVGQDNKLSIIEDVIDSLVQTSAK